MNYSEMLFNRDERLIDKIKQLEEENKQLKEQLEYLRSNEYLNQVKWERNFNEDLVKELQQRINEALEFYEKYGANLLSNGCIKKSIKTILKGEEK